MNKIELITLIREIVKDEFKTLLKSKEGRLMIREIIGKETRFEVDKLLTMMEQAEPQPKQLVRDSDQDMRLSKMVERGELPPKKSPVKPLPRMELTKNKKLNELLNDTLVSIATGKATLPSQEGSEGAAALLREQYTGDDWKTMGSYTEKDARGFGMMRPAPVESSGKSVASMIPTQTVEGAPMLVSPDALPEHVSKALTRDYRKFMKKVDEKRG